jgi:hypothetical protein
MKIRNRWTSEIIYESEKQTLKETLIEAMSNKANLREADLSNANLSNADLRYANLYNADLSNANLWGAKNYYDNHDIALELIRREKISTFNKAEWEIIGKISVHRFCWEKLLKEARKPLLRVFKLFKDKGFDEYYNKYKELIKVQGR